MVPEKTNTNLSVSGTIVHRMEKSSQNKKRSAGPTIVVLGAGINGAALARQFVLNNAHVILADTRDIAGAQQRGQPDSFTAVFGILNTVNSTLFERVWPSEIVWSK